MASFAVNVHITGNDKLVSAIQSAIESGYVAMERSAVQEMEEIRAASMEIVPVDQGILRASALAIGTRVERTSDRIKVSIGYGGLAASYALIQHETPPEIFSHAPGKSWKYLERPVMEAVATMGPRLAARLSAAFNASDPPSGEPGATFGDPA